jgi:hypothetical protein
VPELWTLGPITLRQMIPVKSQSRAFVTNELFIVSGCLVLSAVGTVVLVRALHLSWLVSISLVLAVVAIVVLILSLVFTPRRRE